MTFRFLAINNGFEQRNRDTNNSFIPASISPI